MTLLKVAIGPFVGGALFAIGLGVSGMTEPSKVIGFLDLFGNWDPSLMFVMIGAIGVNAILYRLIIRRKTPLFEKQFHVPQNKTIDKKLLVGSGLFGIGWGISGLCPGPGLVGLLSQTHYAFAFVITMLVGMTAVKWWGALAQPKSNKKG